VVGYCDGDPPARTGDKCVLLTRHRKGGHSDRKLRTLDLGVVIPVVATVAGGAIADTFG